MMNQQQEQSNEREQPLPQSSSTNIFAPQFAGASNNVNDQAATDQQSPPLIFDDKINFGGDDLLQVKPQVSAGNAKPMESDVRASVNFHDSVNLDGISDCGNYMTGQDSFRLEDKFKFSSHNHLVPGAPIPIQNQADFKTQMNMHRAADRQITISEPSTDRLAKQAADEELKAASLRKKKAKAVKKDLKKDRKRRKGKKKRHYSSSDESESEDSSS